MTKPPTGRRMRTAKVLPAAAALALLALALPTAVTASAQDTSGTSSAVTVTGPADAYDPATKSLQKTAPTATVAATADLVDQTLHVSWTGETPTTNDLDNLSDTADATVDPGNLQNSAYGVGVYECAGDAPASIDACYLAVAGSTYGSGGLGNALYALTYADGSGSADMHVETGVTNSKLGCDSTHPCSVAVVPAWGGLQDGTTAKGCNSHKKDGHSDGNALTQNVQTGFCAWANRLVVPLHFAPTPADCPNRTPAFSAVGSPMLERAMSQWQSGWCNDSSPLTFSYNSSSNEYQARQSFAAGGGALTSRTDVALTTQPVATSSTAYTYAPLANTDIAVAFLVDDPRTRGLVTDINLNARLVAKLLTQSYAPASYACLSGGDVTKQGPSCDPAVKGNPTSIFIDPEFVALNPQLTPSDFAYASGNAFGGYFPTVVAGNSDLTYELTRWIASDPVARAFLAGTPDKWHMHVNTYYKGIAYPTAQFEQLDPGFTDHSAGAIAGNGTMQNSWQPLTGLDTIGQTLVGDKASGLLGGAASVCLPPSPCYFPRISELPGHRSLFAVMDQGQAAAYAFPVAHLINSAGHAVAPSAASVSAGLAAAKTNADGITRTPNYQATDPAAYPLSVTDYALVRSCGQSTAVAAAVRSMLGKAAAAQTSGVAPGTLAPGFLPLTPGQLGQVSAARAKVGSAACPAAAQVHPADHPSSAAGHRDDASTGRNGSTGTGPAGASNNGGSAGSSAGAGAGSAGPSASAGATGAGGGAPVAAADNALVANSVRADRAGAARYVLPVVLAVGAVLLILGPGAFVLLGTPAGATVARRLRRLYR